MSIKDKITDAAGKVSEKVSEKVGHSDSGGSEPGPTSTTPGQHQDGTAQGPGVAGVTADAGTSDTGEGAGADGKDSNDDKPGVTAKIAGTLAEKAKAEQAEPGRDQEEVLDDGLNVPPPAMLANTDPSGKVSNPYPQDPSPQP